MKPVIKYPGGKTKEFQYIENMIPSFNRYIEPFFGGGGVFFQLQPKKSIINDITPELINLYRFIKGDLNRELFEVELKRYSTNWDKIKVFVEEFKDFFFNLYYDFKFNRIEEEDFKLKIKSFFNENRDNFNGLFKKEFCINVEKFEKTIEKSIIDKLKRIKKIDDGFSEKDIFNHIETGFKSGFYMFFRNEIMNKIYTNQLNITKEKEISNYYFIREFCYGGMYRYNNKGEFNIPYGGIGYNKKNFGEKVDYLLSNKVKKLFENCIIENLDFVDFFEKYDLKEDDFVFLDPPYDTEFSDYNNFSFTKEHQKKLRDCLIRLKSKFILIIKHTDFIFNLYNNQENIKILDFDKTYLYNVKNRNNRDVKHLIIYNFDFDIKKIKDLSDF